MVIRRHVDPTLLQVRADLLVIREQRGRAARVQHHHRLVRPASLALVRAQTGEHLPRVDRVQEYALCFSHQQDGVKTVLRGVAIAVTDEPVVDLDRSPRPGGVKIEELSDRGPPGPETLAASVGGAIHADPDDRAPDPARAERQQHAGEDAAGPERRVDSGRVHPSVGHLVSQFETGPNIPETAQRRGTAHGDEIRRLAVRTQLVAHRLRLTFEIPVVVGVGEPDVGAHQIDGQQISLEPQAVAAAQHDRRTEPDPPGGRAGQTGMVALCAATGDQDRGARRPGFRHLVLQLAWLVAPERQIGEVVALQVEVQA